MDVSPGSIWIGVNSLLISAGNDKARTGEADDIISEIDRINDEKNSLNDLTI
jgi:hypothetical protein